jgi:hypothetical protein
MRLGCAGLCGRILILVRLAGSGSLIIFIVIVNDYDFFGRLAAKVFGPVNRLVPRSLDSSAI